MNTLPISAIVLMCIGMSLIPLGDTAGKLLTSQFGVASAFVAWSRFALGLLLLSIILGRLPSLALLGNWRIWLRGSLIAFGILSILTALKSEPIANVFGAFFIGPIVSFVLSVVLLRERFEPARAASVALGFVGVLLIVRPGFGWSPGLGFAVLAGCFYGAFLTASRWLSGVAGPRELLLSQLAVGSIILAPIGLNAIPKMTPEIGGLVTASALASGVGNLLLVMAYRRAQAVVLAPLVYTQLLAATALGWFVFADFPDGWTWAGLAVLVISGVGAALIGRRS